MIVKVLYGSTTLENEQQKPFPSMSYTKAELLLLEEGNLNFFSIANFDSERLWK